MKIEDLRRNRVVRKLVELDKKYRWTDMVLDFMIGFGIAVILVYSFPGLFPRVSVSENIRRDTGPDNFPFDNLDGGDNLWKKNLKGNKSFESNIPRIPRASRMTCIRSSSTFDRKTPSLGLS